MCDANLDSEPWPTRTYTCDRCQGTFETDASEAAVIVEALEMGFKDAVLEPDQRMVLCEDCYQGFLKWFSEQTAEQLAAMRAEYEAERNG